MYCVSVRDSKNSGIGIGDRYCFFKRSVKELIEVFNACGCDFRVYKLTRIHGDIFAWSPIVWM